MIIEGYEFIFTLTDDTTDVEIGTFESAKKLKDKIEEVKEEIPIENMMIWYGEKQLGECSYLGSFWATSSILDNLRAFMLSEYREIRKYYLRKYMPRICITPKGKKKDTMSKELLSHKNNFIKGHVLLCPKCWNQLDKCDCLYWPRYAVEIDDNIATAISLLNQKGYVTTYCCSGHYKNGVAYIAFAYMYDFDVPEGWYRSFNGSIHQIDLYDDISESEFNIIQANEMKKILNWVERLPVLDVFEEG